MKRILVYSAQMEAVGGIESHVVQLCLRLATVGYRITLMSSRFALEERTARELTSAGVELVVNQGRWSSSSPVGKWLWTLVALVRLAGRRFTTVYTNGQGRNPATIHAWYRGRTRLVHHHHTACDARDIATWPTAYVEAMKRADMLVVCAEFIRRRMQTALGRSDVTVIHCFSSDPALRPEAPPPASDRVVFGYFGRLIREKGIDWILRLSRDPRLEAVGWMIWGPQGTYRAQDFDAFPNVKYCGPFTSRSGLLSALERLQCYCLFSTHPEGIPISLLEVMGAGKPWIGTRQGGIPELAHDPDSCVLVSLDDYEGVVAACRTMCERIRSGKIDGERQRAFYQARFGGEVLLRRWTELLSASG